jgi:3-hydroxyacyl-[acyl-carrier-protein] dehydratase
MLNLEQIQKILPHRYPFLLVDRIVQIELGKRIVGIKNVTANEPFFQGHFPGHPVMPGVLVIEALAQAGVVLLMKDERNQGKLALFGGMNEVRFRRQVVPGDQLTLEITHIKSRGDVGKVRGVARVGDEVAAECEMTYVLRKVEK